MINQHPKRSDEPVFWGLFGAGGVWFAMFTPITVLILAVLVPLNVIDEHALSYERMSGFASSFFGGLFLILSLVLPMWHAMHRIHHGLHDLKIRSGNFGKVLCYGFAGAMSILALVFVFMV